MDLWRSSKHAVICCSLKNIPTLLQSPIIPCLQIQLSTLMCLLKYPSKPEKPWLPTTEENSLLWNYLINQKIIYLQALFGEAKAAHQPGASEGWGSKTSTTNCHWHYIYEPSNSIRSFPWETRSGQTGAEYFLTS